MQHDEHPAHLQHHFDTPVQQFDSAKLGMWLFLASLGMLFAAGLLGHLVIRFRQPVWPPEGAPGLPGGVKVQ